MVPGYLWLAVTFKHVHSAHVICLCKVYLDDADSATAKAEPAQMFFLVTLSCLHLSD